MCRPSLNEVYSGRPNQRLRHRDSRLSGVAIQERGAHTGTTRKRACWSHKTDTVRTALGAGFSPAGLCSPTNRHDKTTTIAGTTLAQVQCTLIP